MSDDDPIDLSFDEYFSLEGIEHYPVTVAVRDQLADLLRASPGPQFYALSRAIMTTVANLEIELTGTQADLLHLRNNTMRVYARLLDLEGRLLDCGLPLEPPAVSTQIEFDLDT